LEGLTSVDYSSSGTVALLVLLEPPNLGLASLSVGVVELVDEDLLAFESSLFLEVSSVLSVLLSDLSLVELFPFPSEVLLVDSFGLSDLEDSLSSFLLDDDSLSLVFLVLDLSSD